MAPKWNDRLPPACEVCGGIAAPEPHELNGETYLCVACARETQRALSAANAGQLGGLVVAPGASVRMVVRDESGRDAK